MPFFWHLALDAAGFLTPSMQEMSSVVPAAGSLRSAYQLRNALQNNWDDIVLLSNSECLERHLSEDLSPRLEDPTSYNRGSTYFNRSGKITAVFQDSVNFTVTRRQPCCSSRARLIGYYCSCCE